MGRSSTFDETIASEICERISSGESLNEICRDERMPPSRTVRRWVIDDTEGFAARYARAKTLQLEYWADEIKDLSDGVLGTENNAAVQAARLAADNRKWLLAKLMPLKYGDKLEMTGAGGTPLIPAHAQDAGKAASMLAIIAQSRLPKPAQQIEHKPKSDENDGSDDG